MIDEPTRVDNPALQSEDTQPHAYDRCRSTAGPMAIEKNGWKRAIQV